jgi:hypothetical protein
MDMRQFWTRAPRSRFLLVAAAISVITLAASSPIYSAVRGSHVTGHSTASPVAAAGGTSVVSSDCSKATARQVVQRLGLEVNIFNLPDPVQQVLCGPFTGPGSNAMAVTIAAPTCWPTQNWAVFRFTAGDWQLVLNQPAYLSSPLVAVGSDIRETTGVHRSGDPRCFFKGGTHARIWHWDGTSLVAGPWKQVTKGTAKSRADFFSPSGNISCGIGDYGKRGGGIFCTSHKPPRTVGMGLDGRLQICRGIACIGNPGIGDVGTPTMLRYGKQITVGRFRCQSLRLGVRCTVIRSGKGFLINSTGVHRVGV